MTGLAILLAIGLALFWGASVAATAWMLAHPPRRTYAAAVARGRPGDPSELIPPRSFDSWSLRTRGLDLPLWEIAGDDPRGPFVILTHGWGDSRIGGLLRVPAIAPFASRVILWDLPGHGDAPGVCRLGTAEVEDLRALLDATTARAPDLAAAARDDPQLQHAGAPAPARVMLYGWSLGAGVSIVVARGDPRVAGVIAESPYRLPATPARNVLAARALPHRLTLAPALWLLGTLLGCGPTFRVPVRRGELLVRDSTVRARAESFGDATVRERAEFFGNATVRERVAIPIAPVSRSAPNAAARLSFDRADHAPALTCPLLVIHGTEDEVCPVGDGRAIAAAAPVGRLAEIAGAGHNDLWTDPRHAARCGEEVARFFASVRDGRFAGDTLGT